MKVNLEELGWQGFFESQVPADDLDSVRARVIAHRGGHVLFLSESGQHSVPVQLVDTNQTDATGIAVGDWMLLCPHEFRARKLLERKTVIYRKAAGDAIKPQLIAANVDTVFIVSSCNQDFNLSRLERYLALALESGATPVVLLTKSDLHSDPPTLRQQAEKLHPGLVVETLDARDEKEVSVLDYWCSKGKTIALVGSSGVGKSTLANSICELESDIETRGIRDDDAKGRHTTTSRSMHRLKSGGWLIDNPGMRELQLPACEQGIADLFEEIMAIAETCKFRNCSHNGDAGCALEAAVDSGQLDARRVSSFLKLQAEQKRNSASLAQRRERERQTGKMYKRIIQAKNRGRGLQ